MSKKIIYINQRQLTHESLLPVLSEYTQHDWQSLNSVYKLDAGVQGIYSRFGTNCFPLRDQFSEVFGWQVPVYDPKFCLDFDQITDLRCANLFQQCSDRPWLILWSGGIDSTVVLCSILKNLQKNDLDRVVVACNSASICENPDFFYNHVQPNFQIINSFTVNLDQQLLDSYYVFNGEPADQLYSSGSCQALYFANPDNLSKKIKTYPDQLLQYITDVADARFASWYYERMLENINSVDIPVETYHDFFWWHQFNGTWNPIKLRSLHFQTDSDVDSLKKYLKCNIPWFDSTEYQQWAMCNNKSGIKYGQSIGQYKLASKKYIYDFDKNKYYFDFKLKIKSGSITPQPVSWFCILDDLSRLSLDNDLDQILELLPDHIC
jgi:hypothetical protein